MVIQKLVFGKKIKKESPRDRCDCDCYYLTLEKLVVHECLRMDVCEHSLVVEYSYDKTRHQSD